MSNLKLIKISSAGEQLADDATEWDAVLLPDHDIMFTATHVAENVPHADCEAACKASRAAGFADWDMPSIDQLQLLIDRSRYSPAINTDFFRDIADDWYWTSTAAAWSSAVAWHVNFYSGYVDGYHHRYDDGFALAVRRSGQSSASLT